MAFDKRNYDIEEWLAMENNGLLEKLCTTYDGAGRILESTATRVNIVPIGKARVDGTKSTSAPALKREYSYDLNGGTISTVPEIVEWTQACEDVATGEVPATPAPPAFPSTIIPVTQVDFDEINVTYPSDTVEVYTYLTSSIVIRTVTLTFGDDTKERLTGVVVLVG